MLPPQRVDSDSEDFDSGSQNAAKPNEANTKDGSEKKSAINRVNRACNICRRMKMRCVGADDPPCRRCKNAGLECVMEKPGRGALDGLGEERVRSLENQVSAIQTTLSDLVSTLRQGMASSPMARLPPAPDSSAWMPAGPSSNNVNLMAFGQNFGFPPKQEVVLPPRFDGSDPGSTPSYRSQASPYVPPTSEIARFTESMPALPRDLGRQTVTSTFSTSYASQHRSLPPSRFGSPSQEEDILGPEEITNPLGNLSSMAGLVEAAVERAREEQQQTQGTATKTDSGRPEKRARFSPDEPTGPTITEMQDLPLRAATKRKREIRTHIHAYPDAVAEGLVSEAEGRELMRIFFAGSSNFIPCYDPSLDVWDSLRLRSPFSLTTIIMVGARVRDGGGPPSDVQRACRVHAQRIAVGTLFNPVNRVEAVQAMMLLAAFTDNGWLPGGHAVRMATDMGINRSFMILLRSGMGKGKTTEELEEERHLVVQSRVWFCLYLVEHQMAYGMGRPAILREDESIHNCRRLLEHPLSITSDARLVSTVELTALRAPLHVELTAAPDLPLTDNALKRLKQANNDFDAWERYWDRILSDRLGKGRGDFYRESLVIQRQYAELFVNSQLLRGIREFSDVARMPEEQKVLAIRAMRNAQRCLDICLHGENYRTGLRYAVHYTHVCAAFAASFLVRIARMFPHELDLRQTAKDVEELADLLSEVPAGRYARSLRLILRRARKAKVIPAKSTASSPKPLMAYLLESAPTPAPGITPSHVVNSTFYPTPGPAISPQSMMLAQAGHIIIDSPSSGGDALEFDALFAQETLERAGLALGEGDSLPLFLDGHSLGSTAAPTEMTPFVGLENFFIPADVDNRLGGTGEDHGAGSGGDPLGGGVWW